MAASRHTHNFRKCSHASVGLAQARPNNLLRLLMLTGTSYQWLASSILFCTYYERGCCDTMKGNTVSVLFHRMCIIISRQINF